jgi:hypothetical protein
VKVSQSHTSSLDVEAEVDRGGAPAPSLFEHMAFLDTVCVKVREIFEVEQDWKSSWARMGNCHKYTLIHDHIASWDENNQVNSRRSPLSNRTMEPVKRLLSREHT